MLCLFKSARGRAQVCETRIDAVFRRPNGDLVLGEFKTRVGVTTQTSFMATKEMRQALVNCYWFWKCYGVLVRSFVLVCCVSVGRPSMPSMHTRAASERMRKQHARVVPLT